MLLFDETFLDSQRPQYTLVIEDDGIVFNAFIVNELNKKIVFFAKEIEQSELFILINKSKEAFHNFYYINAFDEFSLVPSPKSILQTNVVYTSSSFQNFIPAIHSNYFHKVELILRYLYSLPSKSSMYIDLINHSYHCFIISNGKLQLHKRFNSLIDCTNDLIRMSDFFNIKKNDILNNINGANIPSRKPTINSMFYYSYKFSITDRDYIGKTLTLII